MTKLRCLVVDDHLILATGVKFLLNQLGHEVVDVVRTGQEAVFVAENERPDLIIMDIDLPGDIDGIEAARQIREHFDIPSLFFTGHSGPEMRQRAEGVAPIGFLDKTASKSKLAEVLNAFSLGRKP